MVITVIMMILPTMWRETRFLIYDPAAAATRSLMATVKLQDGEDNPTLLVLERGKRLTKKAVDRALLQLAYMVTNAPSIRDPVLTMRHIIVSFATDGCAIPQRTYWDLLLTIKGILLHRCRWPLRGCSASYRHDDRNHDDDDDDDEDDDASTCSDPIIVASDHHHHHDRPCKVAARKRLRAILLVPQPHCSEIDSRHHHSHTQKRKRKPSEPFPPYN